MPQPRDWHHDFRLFQQGVHDWSKKKRTIQCGRAEKLLNWVCWFSQNSKDSSSNGESSNTSLSFENIRHSEQETFRFGYRYLKVSAFGKDHNYCTIYAKPLKLGVTLAVKDYPKQNRVETLYKSISKNLSENGYIKYRALCIWNIKLASFFYGIKTSFR